MNQTPAEVAQEEQLGFAAWTKEISWCCRWQGIFNMMALRPLQVELEENSVFIEGAWPLNAWFLVCRMPLNTGASSHVLLDPRRLWLASRFWPKNIANPRNNPAQLFFAKEKAKENEEKARESAEKALALAKIAQENEEKAKEKEENARKSEKKALELAKIATRNEEKAKKNEAEALRLAKIAKQNAENALFYSQAADASARGQKLSVK